MTTKTARCLHRLRRLNPKIKRDRRLIRQGFRYMCMVCTEPLKIASGIIY